MIGCLRTRVRKQPIIALYFESENEFKFYNLEALCPFYWTKTNIADQIQTPQKAVSDQGLHCLLTSRSIKIWKKTNLSPNNYKNWKLTHQLVKNKNPIGLGDTDLGLSTIRDFGPHINNLLNGFQDNHSISNQRPCHNMHICHKHTRAHQRPKNLG